MASTRSVKYFQANSINCQIITVPNDLLKKLNNLNKDLKEFSKETVMVYKDAKSAGFRFNQ